MINSSVLDKVNNKRFKSGIEFQKQLLQLTRSIQDQLLHGLPSNYSKDHNTNLAEFFRAVSKEFARLQISSSDVSEDKYNEATRTEYLYQVLGDSLFLGEKSINESLSDEAYRSFLLKVRNAYYEGSRKQNIENAVSDIVGIPVTIKELYLDLRKKSSFYGMKDTHTMFFDILMDQATTSSSIGLIIEDLKFFIDMIKPAHVLYDTRLIWTDTFDNKGPCKPSYAMKDMAYEIYGTTTIYLVTYLASSVYRFDGVDPEQTWVEGTILSIDHTRGRFYLVDNRILVYDSSTIFYRREVDVDYPVVPELFAPGDVIKYYAVKDAAGSSDIINDTWLYSGIINDVYQNENLITLVGGAGIVYSDTTLAYTRDYQGEYRIDIEDLQPNREISFKAEKYTKEFDFYRTPSVVQDNYFRQFDNSIIARPSFQDYVKKNKDIPEGMVEGPVVVVENGVAIVKNIESKFYKRADIKNYKEIVVNRYSLFIDDEFVKQFDLDDPQRTLTQSEAKNVFMYSYGYTGLQDPGVGYRIDVSRTGELIPDGADSTVQAIGDQTQLCDRMAECQLVPFYEDTRKFFTWPDLELTSGFFDIFHDFYAEGFTPGVTGSTYNLPANYYGYTGIQTLENSPLYFGPEVHDTTTWHYISADPNLYQMPLLPMLGMSGAPAEASDVTVYVSGKKVEDAVSTIDPWNGIISLNFIPPFDTKLRIDYYHAERFPGPVYYMKQIISETIQALPNDMPGIFSVLNVDGVAPKLSWPFAITDPALYGDDLDYQMNKFPMLTNKGALATKDDLIVFVGMPIASGMAKVTEISTTGSTLTNIGSADWTSVSDGDVVVIKAKNYLDNTLIYVVQSVDLMNNTLRLPNSLPVLNAEYPYTIIHFTEVADAVDGIRPLLGHVRLNFIPPINSFLKINYYYTAQERQYLMMPDAVDPVGNAYGSSSFTPDTYYGSKNNYTTVVDQNPENSDQPIWDFDHLLKIGYRYRAFNLSNSAVLNSEQFLVSEYEKSGSFKNRVGMLNQFDVMFSGEFLKDTDKNVILNDTYLKKALPPVTVLNPGTPIFAESFTDDAHHRNAFHADEHDTFDPALIGGRDLPASFTIIEPDDSGIIDYNPVCSVTTKKQINLYSDLKQVEFPDGGFDAQLSTIDEGGTSLPFSFTFIDQYYPNRELRLTEYIDYINQVPTEYRTGSLRILNGSSIAKSLERNFKALNVGDVLTIEQVPYREYIGNSWTTVYKNLDYTLVQIIDFETARIHKNFEGISGTYNYTLTRSKTYASDVSLFGGYGETAPSFMIGNLNRALVLNGLLEYTYSLPKSVLQHLPGYGVTGANYTLYFPDPDPDPTPSNPDNPWIPNPTGISYYNIPQYTVDGKLFQTNRLNGTTGLIKTSQIFDSEGNTRGYTGIVGTLTGYPSIPTLNILGGYTGALLISGITGPSGALDLGITGPVGDANPRIYKPSDSYVIPAGDTGIFLSYSEAEYRVQWRNWDQDMMIVSLGVTGGILIEDPVNMMDDIGEGIKRSFWQVSTASLREMRFQGTVIETSEDLFLDVSASAYPNGMILLTQDEVDLINSTINPVVNLPQLSLGDSTYQMRRRIIRELLSDASIKVTEIQEFLAI
jgi:hypothetical protein